MKDAVDIVAPTGVLIENCTIHDAIWFKNGERQDAHGIVTEGVKDFTVRGTTIYYVSGDGLQFQYDGWDNILVENCTLWNGDLPTARGGAPAGVNPGENAVDTKYNPGDGRGKLYIRNTTAYGWRSDYINNAAAFNLKHSVEVELNRITVYDSEIAFRLRGPGSVPDSKGGAWVTLANTVIYDCDKAVRYEDGIENLHLYHITFGNNFTEQFENAGGHGTGFELKNSLFLSSSKPIEASDSSNIAVDLNSFINSNLNNYHLAGDSPAIDSGISGLNIADDRDGKTRPENNAYDIGAYEFYKKSYGLTPQLLLLLLK